MIPLIICNFNQLTYLRNLINWWQWYHPDYPVYIVDNGSDYDKLLQYYSSPDSGENVRVFKYPENDFRSNLSDFLQKKINPKFKYYVISDADIQPHPNTPPDFLKVFERFINQGYHRVGFNLIISDLPEWLHEKAMIVGNETELLSGKEVVNYAGFPGYKVPIDTTFCMYSVANGGWSSPMNGKDWGNCLRLFNAFHYGWYVHGEHLNAEMEHYFKTAKYRVPGEPSAGKNNNRPLKFIR